jgi:hypothetical protein
MSVTSLKRSGIKSGQQKYLDAMAGNFKFAWLDSSNWTLMTRSSAAGGIAQSSNTSRLMVFNNKGEGMVQRGGPSNTSTVTDFGNIVGSQGNIGYDNHYGSFNGWFFGAGNYISSSAGFQQNIGSGWTYITGYNNTTFSGGAGAGGFTSGGVPVWMIPATTGSPGVAQGFLSTTTMPNTSWTLNAVGTVNPSSGGSLNKVALANDVVVYTHYSSNTTFSGATLVIKYAAVTPSTGAISATWNTATLPVAATGMLLALQTVNNVFVLTTTSGDRYTSPDGATWTQRATGTSGTTNNGMQLTGGETGYIIGFSYNSTNTYGVQYSTDGITFTSMSLFSSTSYGNFGAIGVGKGIRFAQTDGGTVWFKQP